VLFIDLDDFKKVNDTLGHKAGDDLLKTIANRFNACVRQDDTVSRLGGDEFTVILPNIKDPKDIEMVSQKILAAASEKLTLGEHEVFVSASIGIALYPSDAEDDETLIKHADIAMYEAKGAGRGRYKFFTPEMNRAVTGKATI
jgi:diguanylate cyclase (GGDEF)-like protein